MSSWPTSFWPSSSAQSAVRERGVGAGKPGKERRRRRLRLRAPLSLQPLTADYWPRANEIPYLRLAAAFALSPLAAAAGFAAIAFVIYALSSAPAPGAFPGSGLSTGGEGGADWSAALAETWRIFLEVWLGVTLQVGLGGALVGPLLWSLRLRSRTAWGLAGILVGCVFAVISWVNTQMPSAPALAVFVMLSFFAFLTFRMIAGVRKIARR